MNKKRLLMFVVIGMMFLLIACGSQEDGDMVPSETEMMEQVSTTFLQTEVEEINSSHVNEEVSDISNESEASKNAEASETTEDIQTEIASTDISANGKEGFIIIGDSHAVIAEGFGYAKMGSSVDGVVLNETLFFVHKSMDPVMGTYDWFAGEGKDMIQTTISQHPDITDWSIISVHGTSMVYTPGITDSYTATYKEWMKKVFPKYDIYIVSVPPLDEEGWATKYPDGPLRYNSDIQNFNNKIKKAFPKNYFDYYEWFEENGTFIDEIHYSGETYVKMFDQIISKIKR